MNLFSHIPRYTFQKFLLLLRLLGRQLHEHFLGPSNSSTRRMESLDFTQGILLAKQSDQLSWIENECKKSFQKRFISSGLWGKKSIRNIFLEGKVELERQSRMGQKKSGKGNLEWDAKGVTCQRSGNRIVPGKSLSCLPLELIVGHLNKMSTTFLVFSVG